MKVRIFLFSFLFSKPCVRFKRLSAFKRPAMSDPNEGVVDRYTEICMKIRKFLHTFQIDIDSICCTNLDYSIVVKEYRKLQDAYGVNGVPFNLYNCIIYCLVFLSVVKHLPNYSPEFVHEFEKFISTILSSRDWLSKAYGNPKDYHSLIAALYKDLPDLPDESLQIEPGTKEST